MFFVYHPDLVEQVVFLVTRADQDRECALHERIDQLYAIADAETRSAVFSKVFGERFAAWKLAENFESQLRTLLGNCDVNRCAMAPAGRSRNQKVDLLIKPEAGRVEHTLFIQVRPESILDPTPLLPWLRGELLQVADMLDEKFGYNSDDIVGSPWERKLRQDRYLVLWRIYVAGRLLRAGHQDLKEIASLRGAFAKAFRHQGTEPGPESFERVLNAEALTHADLLGWAMAPQELLLGRAAHYESGPSPGGLCPLCGFPTYDWFDFDANGSNEKTARIRVKHPQWRTDQGACRQCVETYVHRVERSEAQRPMPGGEGDVGALQKEPICS